MEVGAWRVVHGGWCMEVGAWRVVHGGWCMEGGAWKVVHGGWCMEGGEWKGVHEGGAWSGCMEGGAWRGCMEKGARNGPIRVARAKYHDKGRCKMRDGGVKSANSDAEVKCSATNAYRDISPHVTCACALSLCCGSARDL